MTDEKISKKQLLDENQRLRETVTRLLKTQPKPPAPQSTSVEGDFMPPGWAERHGITIPRADGHFESVAAWVRVRHGIITIAGLKNQSILAGLIGREKLNPGAERYGNLYMDWRAAFFARNEAARYSDTGSGDPEAWSKEDRFSKLLKAVERKHLRHVDLMVAMRPKEKDVASFTDDPKPFLDSFARMVKAMNTINDDADQALQAKRAPVSKFHMEENACA